MMPLGTAVKAPAAGPDVAVVAAAAPLRPAAPASRGPSLAAAQDLEATYSLGRLIGRGSFAAVHEVTNRFSGERFCAKKLPRFTQTRQPCQQEAVVQQEVDFQRVLSAASGSILRLHDVCCDDNFFYIISELCQCDLKRYLEGRLPVREREAAHIIRQLLLALHTCHSHGVAYRDVKPGNLLIRFGDEAPGAGSNGQGPLLCLADFGCSCSLVGPQGRSRSSPGTPLFSAPECVEGKAGTDSDVWSAGILLYELLTGGFPFCDPSQSISQSEYWHRVAHAPIRFSGPAWHHVSPPAVKLLRRMLERDRSSRITAREALEDPWLLDMCDTASSTGGGSGSRLAVPARRPTDLHTQEPLLSNVVRGLPITIAAA